MSTASTPLARARAICAALAVLACACAGIPLTAESGDGLHGAYFDNQDLSGTPVLERTDPQVAFDWDGGAPDASVPADGFSVRWDGWVVPDTTGAHTFHARTDDGVRLWVDGELLVDNWKDQGAKERSGTVSLLAGRPVAIRMEYYENGGGAVAELRWTPPGGSKAFVPQAVLFTAAPSNPPPLAGGLQGSYFANPDLYADPVLERLDPEPQFDWGSGSPDPSIPVDDFSVRWVGRITAPVAGAYRFHTRTDDGTNLWIDGELVVDDWNDHGPTTRTSREFTLAEGQVVQVVWEYYESGGGAVAELLWSYGGSPIHAMPTFALDPDIDPSIYLGTGTGLSARYFNNPHVDGEPDLTRTDPAIDFDWGGSSPDPSINAEFFSVEWTGTLETQYGEDYTLEYAADDGVLVWIDGKLLIDEWHTNGGSIHTATFRGEAGKKFPIRVLHYEQTGGAEARLFWSSASRPRQLVPEDRLYPTEAAGPSLTIPASSPVSPAFVEGSVPAGRTGDLAITAGTVEVTPQELTARSFFADLPLDPAAAQPVSIGLPDGTPVTGSITWTPTQLDGGPAVVIRQDDRLLFPASPGSTLTVLIASGTYATQTVPAAGQAVFAFPDPGHYVVQDESLKERDVTVVGIDFPHPVASEVGFTRPLDVSVRPDAASALFRANDPSLLGVATRAFDDQSGLLQLTLTPAGRGTPMVLGRIEGPHGPVFWDKEVDEFTLEATTKQEILVFANTGQGLGKVIIRPFVPDIDFTFDMFAGPAVWADGSTFFEVNTSDPSNAVAAWTQTIDSETGETVGVLELDFILPENGDKYCFKRRVFQTYNPTIEIAEDDNSNGAVCSVRAHGGVFAIPEVTDERAPNLSGAPLQQTVQSWAPTAGMVFAEEDGEGELEYLLEYVQTFGCAGVDDSGAEGIPGSGSLACPGTTLDPGPCGLAQNFAFADCDVIWSPKCKQCADMCVEEVIHTGLIPGSVEIELVDCGNGMNFQSEKLVFLNKVDMDGFSGGQDASHRDPMPPFICAVTTPAQWPDLESPIELVGTPVQVTLIGEVLRAVRVASPEDEALGVSTEPQITVEPGDTLSDHFAPCVEVPMAEQEFCRYTGVVYVYGFEPVGGALLETHMSELRPRCVVGDTGEQNAQLETDWVVTDKESINIVFIDIDVDSDNNGTIDEADDPVEEGQPGKLICENSDDDGEPEGPDDANDEIDGAEDLSDFAGLNLSLMGTTIEDIQSVSLEQVPSDGTIRIFDEDQNLVMGPGPGSVDITGRFDPGEFESFIFEGAEGGAVNLVFSVTILDGTVCEDRVVVSVAKSDLDVDSNNDGVIDEADDPGEEEPDGHFLCVNRDDDDGDDNPDNENQTIDGMDDRDDMSALDIDLTGFDENDLPTVCIEQIEGPGQVRIFDLGGNEVMGPEGIKSTVQGVNADKNEFLIEGVEPGGVKLRLTVESPTGEVCLDEVYISVLDIDLDVDAGNDGAIDDDDEGVEDEADSLLLCVPQSAGAAQEASEGLELSVEGYPADKVLKVELEIVADRPGKVKIIESTANGETVLLGSGPGRVDVTNKFAPPGGNPNNSFLLEGVSGGLAEIRGIITLPDGTECIDSVLVTVVQSNLNVDTNEDGEANSLDEIGEEIDPGHVLCKNDDDDDGDEVIDSDNNVLEMEDDDLTPIRIDLSGYPQNGDLNVALTKTIHGGLRGDTRVFNQAGLEIMSPAADSVDLSAMFDKNNTVIFLQQEGVFTGFVQYELTVELPGGPERPESKVCRDVALVSVVDVDASSRDPSRDAGEEGGWLVCVNSDNDDFEDLEREGTPEIDKENERIDGDSDLFDLHEALMSVDFGDSDALTSVLRVAPDSEGAGKVRIFHEILGADPGNWVRIFGPDDEETNNDPLGNVVIEGVEPGTLTLELGLREENGEQILCKERIELTVIGVEVVSPPEDPAAEEGSEREVDGYDLVRVFNGSPVIAFDQIDPPETENPEVTVTGRIVSFVAPLSESEVFVNGASAASVSLTDAGEEDLGPFHHTFSSAPLRIGNDDFEIVANAVNPIRNVGYRGVRIVVDREDDGLVKERIVKDMGSSSDLDIDDSASLSAYFGRFRYGVRVTDPLSYDAAGSEGTVEVRVFSADLTGGALDFSRIELMKGDDDGVFEGGSLLLLPHGVEWPDHVSEEVKEARTTTLLGVEGGVTYIFDPDPPNYPHLLCSDVFIPEGILLLRGSSTSENAGAVVDVLKAGRSDDTDKDEDDLHQDLFRVIAGGPGWMAETISAEIEALDFDGEDTEVPSPARHHPDAEVTGVAATLSRISADRTDPQSNMYSTDDGRRFMAINGRMKVDENGDLVADVNPFIGFLYADHRGRIRAKLIDDPNATIEELVDSLGVVTAGPEDINQNSEIDPPMAAGESVPLFTQPPVVLIEEKSEDNIGIPGAEQNFLLTGEVVSFVNELNPADVSVNGVPLSAAELTQDPHNPIHGPWRAEFTVDVPIDLQMRRQSAVVVAVDDQRNIGRDGIEFLVPDDQGIFGGGRDPATGDLVEVFVRAIDHQETLPASDAVADMVSDGSLTLREAIVFRRNREFRVEGNPALRGGIHPLRIVDAVDIERQLDGVDVLDFIDPAFPLDVTADATGAWGGGGFATRRLILLPSANENQDHDSVAGHVNVDPGMFLRIRSSGQAADRSELVFPRGLLIQSDIGAPDLLATDVVIPGNWGDVGGDPAEIVLSLQIAISGFDQTGSGREDFEGKLNSLSYDGSDVDEPQSFRPFREDRALGAHDDPAQVAGRPWFNFARASQDLEFRRMSDDPDHPHFHLFSVLRADDDEEVITPISTSLFARADQLSPADVSDQGGVDPGLHHVETAGWLRLTTSLLPDDYIQEAVYGARIVDMVTTTAEKTGAAGAEIPDNFERDRDFAVQLRERPVLMVEAVRLPRPRPGAPDPDANAFLLRVEREFVEPATDTLPDDTTPGVQTVGWFDVDAAADHQEARELSGIGSFRFPPSGANTPDRWLRIGGSQQVDGRDELGGPEFAVDVGQGVSPRTFEGLNQPNVGIDREWFLDGDPAARTRRALPSGLYHLRPMVNSPIVDRFVFSPNIRFSVPEVINLDYAHNRDGVDLADFEDDLRNHFELIHDGPLAGGGSPADQAALREELKNAYIDQINMLVSRAYGIESGVIAADSANVRFVYEGGRPSPNPVLIDYVMDVWIGGRDPGSPNTGASLSSIILHNILNSDHFPGQHRDFSLPGGGIQIAGIHVRAYLGYAGTINFDNIFNPFRGPGAGQVPFGANPMDDLQSLAADLSAGILQGPGMVAVWDRNEEAQNAAVAFCRLVAGTTAHEIGHGLGLTKERADVQDYVNHFNIDVNRADSVSVGSPTGGGHNGHLIIGSLPTFNEPGAAGVAISDDLGNNARIMDRISQNYLMDSGAVTRLIERLEPGDSLVRRSAANALTPNEDEPPREFFPRNRDLILSVLRFEEE